MKVLLPKKRPQDVRSIARRKKSSAMMMLGEGTPYFTHASPRFGPVDSEYLDFKGVPKKKMKQWSDAYMWLYRRLI